MSQLEASEGTEAADGNHQLARLGFESTSLLERLDDHQVAKQREDEKSLLAEAGPKRDKKGRILAVAPEAHPVKPGPPNVLSEEDYSEVVGQIIERDFFPDLPQLRARQDLIRAHRSGDIAMVREAEQRLLNLPRPTPGGTPGATPAGTLCPPTPASLTGATTPGPEGASSSRRAGINQQHLSAWERDDDAQSTFSMPRSEDPTRTRLRLASGKEVVVDLSKVRLDDFQRVFTSEDNASFEEILRKDKAKLAFKERYMEAEEERHQTEHNHQKMMLANGEDLSHHDSVMLNEFKARNEFMFKQRESLPLPQMERPKVDFTNTRFTTKQQIELENRLGQAILSRKFRLDGEKSLEEAERMAKDGNFSLADLKGSAWYNNSTRAIAGKIQASPMPGASLGDGGIRGFGMVHTPSLLPGEGGLSPLMTYGKIGSTPLALDEDTGGRFTVQAASAREEVADRLLRNCTQQKRDHKTHSKNERLRALGIPTPGPSRPGTPASSSGLRKTPGSGKTPGSEKMISPMSPIGQLIKAAKRKAQDGGRLGIRGTPTPRSTPTPRTPGSATPGGSTTLGGRGASSVAAGSRSAAAGERRRRPEEDAADVRPKKRARGDSERTAEAAPLPASIDLDGLL